MGVFKTLYNILYYTARQFTRSIHWCTDHWCHHNYHSEFPDQSRRRRHITRLSQKLARISRVGTWSALRWVISYYDMSNITNNILKVHYTQFTFQTLKGLFFFYQNKRVFADSIIFMSIFDKTIIGKWIQLINLIQPIKFLLLTLTYCYYSVTYSE